MKSRWALFQFLMKKIGRQVIGADKRLRKLGKAVKKSCQFIFIEKAGITAAEQTELGPERNAPFFQAVPEPLVALINGERAGNISHKSKR